MKLSLLRMVAIDLDGTLLSPTGRLSPRTRSAVHRSVESGLVVCFATGRNYTESRSVIREVGHEDLCVFVGGAMVVDAATGRTLRCTRMDPELARELCGAIEDRGNAVLALQDGEAEGVDYLIGGGELNAATRQWLSVTSATHRRLSPGELAIHGHENTIRVGIVASPAEAVAVEAELQEKFVGRTVWHNIHVPTYGVDVLEAFDPHVSKWSGILEVARVRGIKPEQIAAVGDDVNDLPMIRQAALGVAMGNARAVVKDAAKLVIGSNADDGLAVFLEELVAAVTASR